MSSIILASTGVLEASGGMAGRIFGLDMQLFVDAGILALAVFALFTLMSYLLFNPARELLRKRQEKIKSEMDFAATEKADAVSYKAEYDNKLKSVNKEAEVILSQTRKKALKKETEIVDEAKAEATRIIDRANKEAELEKSKMKDEVKQEMISVAAIMAGKIISTSIDEDEQAKLIEDTLTEMGDDTWQS
ncbi:F0F1 ATP synthase subunit B [Anaerosporobacter sp.]|uniref:F0F1 ATP synthase subunit B n=1 Tax=Anaerosporobacter sp. TaxID=1872529 RepID=UPI00280B7830|nr:F0F1 ATP synthase subunit B [Anaerosporobacter sp.]